MSISARLKEERLRLGLSQPAFAALAGVTKSAQIKWEAGTSSAPTAPALAAFAEAGADVLYILTGHRLLDRPENAATQIEDQLAEIERDLLEPGGFEMPGEDEDRAEQRVMSNTSNALQSMLKFDAAFLTSELRERALSLLEIASDPAKLALYRAADYAQMRKKREQMRERLAAWLDDGPYEPGEAVRNLLVLLGLKYAVPVKALVELVHEMHTDITELQADKIDHGKPIGWRP